MKEQNAFIPSDELSGFVIEFDGNLVYLFNLNYSKRGFLASIAPFIKATLNLWVRKLIMANIQMDDYHYESYLREAPYTSKGLTRNKPQKNNY